MENILVFLLVLSMPSIRCGKKLKRLENRIAIIEARQDSDSITRREYFSDLSQRLNDMDDRLNSSLTDLSVSRFTSEMTEGAAIPGAIVSEVDSSLVDDLRRIKTAFADEKARWRRQASYMEHSIQAVQNGLSSEMQSIVKTVKNELVTEVSKMMTELKYEMASEMQSSVNTVKNELASEMQSSVDTVKNELASEMQSSVNTVKNELASEVQSSIETVRNELASVSTMLIELKDETVSVKDVESVKDTLLSIIQDTSIKCTSPVILDRLNKIEMVLDEHKSVDSSCLELYRSGERVSGAYDIVLAAYSEPIRVYCDMATDGGGWTVFQRRQDGSEDFYRGLDDYASGFGDVEKEFWLGNDYISEMTRKCCHELRVDMEDFEGNTAYAKYGRFKVFPIGDDYKLDVGEYSGNASDTLAYHQGFRFSTKDKDNDEWSYNCAQTTKGAWWYKACHKSNLNGLYIINESKYNAEGITWYHWKNGFFSLKKTEMKLRKI